MNEDSMKLCAGVVVQGSLKKERKKSMLMWKLVVV